MQGRIIKGIAGFYYIAAEDTQIYECKAKGIFRKEKLKPLVGDYVEIEVLDQEHRTGNIINVLPRENMLIGPAVANIDQALVIFAAKGAETEFFASGSFSGNHGTTGNTSAYLYQQAGFGR